MIHSPCFMPLHHLQFLTVASPRGFWLVFVTFQFTFSFIPLTLYRVSIFPVLQSVLNQVFFYYTR